MGTTNVVAVFLLFLTLGQGEQFSTKPVEGNSGLYFEETGKIFFYSSKWKIVTNVNLTKYRTEFNDNKNIVKTIINSCEELKLIETAKNTSNKGSEGCGPILYQLTTLITDIEENDSNWFGRDQRFKRHIVSELFLNDWPADQLTFPEEFRNMSALGSTTRTVTEKQTSYISSTLNTGGNEKSRSIYDYVAGQLLFVSSTLSAAKNGSVNVMRLFQLRTNVQDIISYQMLMLNRFLLKQKEYFNIMKLVGKRNSEIPDTLPSDILISELNNIRNIVGENGLDLPTKISSEYILFLYHISSPEIVRLNDQIFSILKVPLISKYSGNHFSLFKVTSSLYNVKDNLYSFVVPSHEFIAIDAHKIHYTTLTFEDLNNCHQIKNKSSIICEETSPIMPTLASSECEIRTLLRRDFPMEQSNCQNRYIRNNAEIFIKVLKSNSWLVIMPKPTSYRYICEGKNTQEFFSQINGLLTLDPNCKFATNNVLITGHTFFPKILIYDYPHLNLSEKFKQQREISGRILSDDYFLSNDIPQVVNFGEKEKLLRISYDEGVVNDMALSRDLKIFIGLGVGVLMVYLLLFISVYMYKIRNRNRSSIPLASAPTLRTLR